MRLHRTITPDAPLLVVALEEEAAHLHVSDLPVLVTGVGKVNAAVALGQILGEHSPARVINLGTAGALRDGLSGTLVVGTVLEHDLDDVSIHALTGLHATEPIELDPASGIILATGDRFVSTSEERARIGGRAHLVDMEGYAIAKACRVAGIPLTMVKQVSDGADEGAGRSWRRTVDECAEQLGAWLRASGMR